MIKYLKNENGSALAFLLVTLVVLSIIGVGLLNTSLGDTKIVEYQESTKQAYYLARSGADSVAYHIINNPTSANNLISKTPVDNSSLGNGIFRVAVNQLANSNLELVSTGTVNNVNKAITLILELQDASGIFQHAVFSDESINLDGLYSISGNVGSNGSIEGDKVIRDVGYKDSPYSNVTYPEPDFPTSLTPSGNYELKNGDGFIEASGEYGTFSTDPNSNLTFGKVDETSNIRIVVDDLSIKGNVEVVGDTTLSFYINSSANFQTPRLISDNNPNKVFIYLKADSELSLSAGMEFTGYIYGPSADIKHWSNKTQINGAVVADTFSANGNPSITYIKPSSTTDVSGSIVMYKKSLWKN